MEKVIKAAGLILGILVAVQTVTSNVKKLRKL